MQETAFIVSILQTAVGPAILISGAGLLLLSMTNRMGRIIDRSRMLASQGKESSARVSGQLEILWGRARIRTAIWLVTTCALLSAILIIVIFVSAALRMVPAWIIGTLFAFSMLSLIASLVYFIKDVNLSLHALEHELKPDAGQ
jgi:hypothetical protein